MQTHKPGTHPLTTQTPTHKWATLTYIGKETTFITSIFRRANLKKKFRTNNTIQNLLMRERKTNLETYKLTKKACVGQTSRMFAITFKENTNAFRNKIHTFAQNAIEQVHSCDTIRNIMQINNVKVKGLNLIESNGFIFSRLHYQ